MNVPNSCWNIPIPVIKFSTTEFRACNNLLHRQWAKPSAIPLHTKPYKPNSLNKYTRWDYYYSKQKPFKFKAMWRAAYEKWASAIEYSGDGKERTSGES